MIFLLWMFYYYNYNQKHPGLEKEKFKSIAKKASDKVMIEFIEKRRKKGDSGSKYSVGAFLTAPRRQKVLAFYLLVFKQFNKRDGRDRQFTLNS